MVLSAPVSTTPVALLLSHTIPAPLHTNRSPLPSSPVNPGSPSPLQKGEFRLAMAVPSPPAGTSPTRATSPTSTVLPPATTIDVIAKGRLQASARNGRLAIVRLLLRTHSDTGSAAGVGNPDPRTGHSGP
jgi:hypothetical protein